MNLGVGALRPVARVLTPLTRVGPFGKMADSATRKMYGFWIRTRRGERPKWRFEWPRKNWGIEQHAPADVAPNAAPYPI